MPCELDEKEFECDFETRDKLDKLTSDSDENESENSNNPLWEQLNKIKKFNKN